MSRRGRRILLVLLALVAAGAGALFLVVAPLRPAAAFLKALEGPEPGIAELTGAGLVRWPAEGPLAFLYLPPPPDRAPAPVVVTVAGVTPAGVEDPRVLRLLVALRAAGLGALAPQIPSLSRLGEGGDGLAVVQDALRYTQGKAPCGRLPGLDPVRVGVLGISLGAPLALRAASTSEVAVRVAILVGSPDDPRTLVADWFREPVAADGASRAEAERSSAGTFARHGVLRVAARRRLPAEEAALATAWLDAAGETPLPRAPAPPALTSEAGRRWRAAALAEADIAADDLTWIVEAADGLLSLHAPAAWDPELAGLRASVYLLHGEGDPLVPPSEMDRLAARLRPRAPVHALPSRLLSHVDVGSPGLWETWRHLRWVHDAFEELEREVR